MEILAADVRQEFGSVVNVTDKCKANSDGSVTLAGGTKVPANAYVDNSGVLRASNGSVVKIKPKRCCLLQKKTGGVIHTGTTNRLKHMSKD